MDTRWSKTCTRCGLSKDRSAFARDRTRRDGLQVWCRDCRNRRRLGGRTPRPRYPALDACESPSSLDLAWAAGFLEGEGSFGTDKERWARVEAQQVEWMPITRLIRMFGGSVNTRTKPGCSPILIWVAYGARARGVMMTLYPFMSPKRKRQIRYALGH